MGKEQWDFIINDVWYVLCQWQTVQKFKEYKPDGSFFRLSWYATKNELLMSINRVIQVVNSVKEELDLEVDAQVLLEELNALHEKGYDNQRGTDYENCGIKAYRNKVLGHPVDVIRAILGKEFKISLDWDTVEETIISLKEFCHAVEQQNANKWNVTSYLDKVYGVDEGFDKVMNGLYDGESL